TIARRWSASSGEGAAPAPAPMLTATPTRTAALRMPPYTPPPAPPSAGGGREGAVDETAADHGHDISELGQGALAEVPRGGAHRLGGADAGQDLHLEVTELPVGPDARGVDVHQRAPARGGADDGRFVHEARVGRRAQAQALQQLGRLPGQGEARREAI